MSTRRLPSLTLFAVAGVCIVAVGLGIAAVVSVDRQGGDSTATFEPQRDRSVVLIASGDTGGWIVPCGCASNQSGGLLRRGSFVSAAGEQNQVVLVDAGGAPGGTSPYEKIKFEAILKGELSMGLFAHNIGQAEADIGTGYLREVARRLGAPLISSNLRDRDGRHVVEPYRIGEFGGRRLCVVGVLSKQYETDGSIVAEPREAVLDLLDTIRGRYDWLVVLAYLPEDELRTLAAELPEADVIVGGPTRQSIAPVRIGPCLLASATNKGKFLVVLDAPTDVEPSAWDGRVVEMSSEFPDDPSQEENLRAFYEELARLDFSADQSGFVPPLPAGLPASYQVAGTKSCLLCHPGDCRLWGQSKHAHAWQTLTENGAHVDSYCQQCHTTGFGLPGGFQSAGRSVERTAVGCESCHGPSIAHVEQTSTRTPFNAKEECVRCHDRENSPQFEYVAYWKKIVHGEPAANVEQTGAVPSSGSEVQP